MRLDALAGNEPLKRQLSAQAAGRGLSHAYLISGPAGSGKRTLARLMAAAMVCTGGGEVPCGTCSGCKKALGGIHPDVTVLGNDGREITVAQARAVRAGAYIRPNEAPRKVYIFQNAQNMNNFAQNALLKLLEEGPAYAAFLLLTENPGALLPTIRSRCEGVSLSPVSLGEAEAYLARRFPDKLPQEVRNAAQACGGLLGRGVALLESDGGSGELTLAGELLSLLARGDELALATWCVALERLDRDALAALMEDAVTLLRDALALQAGMEPLSPPEVRGAVRAAAGLPRRQLMDSVRQLEQLRAAAQFNVGVGHLSGALCAGLASAR